MLEFRPHHFMCTLGFEGHGYSPEFVRGYQKIADQLRKDPNGDDMRIRVVERTDSICSPCPHKRGDKCESEGKIQTLDRGHASVLGVKGGDELTWRAAKKLVADKMTDEAFNRVCAPCAWKSMGVCHQALVRTREEMKG